MKRQSEPPQGCTLREVQRVHLLLQGRALGMDQILGRMAEEKQKKLQAGLLVSHPKFTCCEFLCIVGLMARVCGADACL